MYTNMFMSFGYELAISNDYVIWICLWFFYCYNPTTHSSVNKIIYGPIYNTCMICSNHYHFVVLSIICVPPNSIEMTHINIDYSIDMIWLLGNKLCNKYLLYACVCELLFLVDGKHVAWNGFVLCIFLSVTKIYPFCSIFSRSHSIASTVWNSRPFQTDDIIQ